MALENGPFTSIFRIKPPFIGDFPLPCLSSRGESCRIVNSSSLLTWNKCPLDGWCWIRFKPCQSLSFRQSQIFSPWNHQSFPPSQIPGIWTTWETYSTWVLNKLPFGQTTSNVNKNISTNNHWNHHFSILSRGIPWISTLQVPCAEEGTPNRPSICRRRFGTTHTRWPHRRSSSAA